MRAAVEILVQAIGLALIVVGLFMWWPPAAFVGGGLALLVGVWAFEAPDGSNQ